MKGKKFNMAEARYRDADVYDCQVEAHKIFFEDKLPNGFEPLPKEDWPSSMPRKWTGTVYDITEFDGQKVVALLSQIVNDKEQFTMNKTFYLLIRESSEDSSQAGVEELFRLKARPSPPDQPGNSIIFLRPRGRTLFKRGSATSYVELNGNLEGCYDKLDDEGKLVFSDTISFARDMKQLLKNNAQINKFPQPTVEAYMLLLFEIARRLVKTENPSERKQAFDVLPIGSAIARLIKLLESGNCSFKDVFFPGKKFHCFSDKPDVRRKAIEEINEAHMNIKYPKETRVTVNLTTFLLFKEAIEERETKRQLQELQETFCPDNRSSVEELAQTLKDLNMRIGQERSGESSRLLSTSNAERNSAFDHLE